MYRVIENRQCNAHEPLTRKRINYTMTIGINFSIRVTVFIEKLHECVFFRVIVFHRKSYTNQKNANYTRKRATLMQAIELSCSSSDHPLSVCVILGYSQTVSLFLVRVQTKSFNFSQKIFGDQQQSGKCGQQTGWPDLDYINSRK